MNKYKKKADRMRSHLINHPCDYQSVISLFQADSDAIAYELEHEKNLQMREIAKYKKESANNGK